MSDRRVVIVQARMGSSRLPGKVLLDIGGKPMLARLVERLRTSRRTDDIVLATTNNPADDAIARLGRELGVGVFRGSEPDVLDRYARAAARTRADIVARITSDCPLIDAGVLDRVIEAVEAGGCDYASNVLGRRTYPRGLDAEALTREALERAAREATSKEAREHVTWHIWRENPGAYRCVAIEDAEDNSDLRWTVDTEADLEAVRRIFAVVGPCARYQDILRYARANPEIARINAHVRQKDE